MTEFGGTAMVLPIGAAKIKNFLLFKLDTENFQIR